MRLENVLPKILLSMRVYQFFLLVICLPIFAFAQDFETQLQSLTAELAKVRAEEEALLDKIEKVKLQRLQVDLSKNGLPKVETGEMVIYHSAMALVYSEEHEQAKWVAHIISPDIIDGNVSRSNDFRPDPKVVTGTAVEEDYFLKYLQPDSSYKYDGYGYDRGHLAPSADFRWSASALSESYFYSNMSPQRPEFNRGKWAELEGFVRGYIYRHPKTQLYVVTGPVLKDNLPRVTRSVNGVSLPELYFKVVLDLNNQRAIAYLMPNQEITAPISSFTVSIDKVEEETGIDFFPALEDALENQLEQMREIKDWLPPSEQSDVEPLDAPSLPRNHFNTVQAKRYMGTGETINVCGTVVSTNLSRKGNVFLNIDKKFPNQIFTATIWKDNLINFSYEPHEELMGKQICIEGEVRNFNGTPSISVEKEEQIQLYEE